jgi:MoaA/NifB/PqqE/SkfB family radical SAM enzyme
LKNFEPMKALSNAGLMAIVAIPFGSHTPAADLSTAAAVVLKSIQSLADSLTGARTFLVAYDNESGSFREPGSGRSLARIFKPFTRRHGIAQFFTRLRTRQIILLIHPSILLGENPNVARLIDRALSDGIAACGYANEIYALAMRAERAMRSPGLLREAFRSLTSCGESSADRLAELLGIKLLPPFASNPLGTPTMAEVGNPTMATPYDAPSYLNRALVELISWPAASIPIQDDFNRLAQALQAQRDRSRVPWIFNELINEIEFRTGATKPTAPPPEVHISLTGVCNIECKFCSYLHAHARPDMVTRDQIERLDFLRLVRTLRLQSGNGDPTANRHSPAIIGYITQRFPHIGMNFFTNGVLLDRKGLIAALVGSGVNWINVSLNAATRDMWRELCGADQFERVCDNLRHLLREKRARATANPVAYGSMVLTRKSVFELPLMPALCRELGIDRFTAIPFFSQGYQDAKKYDVEDAYHHIGLEYDRIYTDTVASARGNRVSIELPLPCGSKDASFGVEKRVLHDFAQIEPHEWRVGKLLSSLELAKLGTNVCHYLWRQAAIGSTSVGQGGRGDTHYLYPCLGPLGGLQTVAQTAFHFPDETGFIELWQNSLFTLLRQAQHQRGLSRVCDKCQGCDSRDPQHLTELEKLVAEFADEHGLVV